MSWRDLADELDRGVVETFDYGDISLRKMVDGAPVGVAIPLPGDFEAAFQSIRVTDGLETATVGPAVTVHFGHLPDGVAIARDDRIVLATGRHAGTYLVAEVEPNSDGTGAVLKLRREARP